MLEVELAVDDECLALHLDDACGVIFAEGLLGLQGEVEHGAALDADEMLLEAVHGYAEASDKLEWAGQRGLFYQLFLAVNHRIEFVGG